MIKVVTAELLRQISKDALQSPRLRLNHNFHRSNDSRCHRLLNAMEPASYIRPHRHLDSEKDEAFILMRGSLGVVTFAGDGTVLATVLLSHATGDLAVDIPHGVFHTAVSLEAGTVFYETKAGPYLPLATEEKAVWAPEEGGLSARVYLEQMRRLFD